jgi:hypothetical protein
LACLSLAELQQNFLLPLRTLTDAAFCDGKFTSGAGDPPAKRDRWWKQATKVRLTQAPMSGSGIHRQQNHKRLLLLMFSDVLPFPKCAQISTENANRKNAQAREQAALSSAIHEVQEAEYYGEQNGAGADLAAYKSRFPTRDCLFSAFFQLSHFVLVQHG